MVNNYHVIWAKTANEDLVEIIKFIRCDSPNTAKIILAKFKKSAVSLKSLPQRGRIVPELKEQGVIQYQELIIKTWRMIYRVSDNTVYVLSVIDTRRNIEDILLNRLIRGA